MQQPEQRRPALVLAGYPEQRYFANSHKTSIYGEMPEHRPDVDVYRIADRATADLRINLAGRGGQVRIALTADALRLLASDLLDAAQDLEDNPPPHMAVQSPQGVLTFVNGDEVAA